VQQWSIDAGAVLAMLPAERALFGAALLKAKVRGGRFAVIFDF
jgi:hypothetical protein